MIRKKRNTQITNIRNERRDIITDSTDTKRITNHDKQLYANKSDNLDKTDKYLQTTYMTNNSYLEYINNSKFKSKKPKIQVKMSRKHEETFHQNGYTDGKYDKFNIISHQEMKIKTIMRGLPWWRSG